MVVSWQAGARLLLGGAMALMLSACGGGSSDDDAGSAQLRVLNLSDVATLDVYLDDERKISAAGQGALGSYQAVDDDEFDVELRKGNGDISLVAESRSFGKDAHYTLLAYGRESALRFVTLPEDEDLDDLTDGKAGLRVFHAGVDVGDLDIYLTSSDTDLAETVPTQSGLSSGRLSGTRELSPGTYRLRVTGYGDSADLRLDLPAVTLKADKLATLILTGGSGGVLVHGGQLEQQAQYLGLPNTKARLRTVAGAAARGVVSASWQGRSIVGGLTSPSVGPYALVDAGSGALDVRVAGSTVSNATRQLAAGGDYTLLVHGSGATSLISDDNRLPTSGSSRARIRLVHGAPTSDALTLSVDYAVVAADVGLGSSSAFFNISSAEERRLDVTAASAADALYVAEDTRIQSGAVYTVFVLGGASTPTGLLRKDR